jgi:hypothetical protein
MQIQQVYEMYGYVNRPEIKSNDDDAVSLFSKPQRTGDQTLLFSEMKRMPPKLRKLGEALNGSDCSRREFAKRRLARLGAGCNATGNKVDDLLHLTLTFGTPMARSMAAETFVKIGYSRRFDVISGMLIAIDDESPYVQMKAITALGASRLRDKRLTSALFQCVGSPIDAVRHAAARAINLTYRWRTAKCIVHPHSPHNDLTFISEQLELETSPWVSEELIAAKKRIDLEKRRFERHFLENVLGVTCLKNPRQKGQNQHLE